MFALSTVARKTASLLIVAAAMLLSSCDDSAMTGATFGQRINPGKPIEVGLLLPASDFDGGGAILAESAENAARLAVADLQDVEIDLRVYDTGGTPEGASAAATRAIAEGAKILLGPVFSQTTLAAAGPASSADVNILSLSNNEAIAGGRIFLLGSTFGNTADRLVAFALRQGKRNVFVMHGNSLAEGQARDAVANAVFSYDATLVGSGSFDLSQEGVTAALPVLASQAKAAAADIVFLTSGNEGALPFLADLLPEQGLGPDVVQYAGMRRLDIPTSALSVRGLQGSWFTLPDTALDQAFVERYRATYGNQPHPIVAAPAYDGIAAIGALAARGDANALTSTGLTRSSGFVGASGVFRLFADGTNQRGLAVAQVQDGKVVVIDPAPRSFSGSGF